LIYQGFSNDFSSFSFVKQFPHLGKNAKKQWGRGGFTAQMGGLAQGRGNFFHIRTPKVSLAEKFFHFSVTSARFLL
jgi:hypothetical protein